ncbi:proto-oncogene Mas-like [Rhineura floridana]|uniref:proto-oncogene Mas-like n=1 Tax=Rhineura floridana TaxID=261503 RepID=UPI002AC84306|nr:proto-oncogene Mas-like [Rhineura floridana]
MEAEPGGGGLNQAVCIMTGASWGLGQSLACLLAPWLAPGSALLLVACSAGALGELEALTEFFIPLHKNIVISQIVDVLGLCGHDASFFVLTAAAAERCLTVYFPNWWQHHRPKHFTITVCVILWLLSGLMPLAGYFACFPRVRATNETEFVSCKNPAISQMIIVLLIFISILGFSASAIFMKMKINQAPPPARLDITILTTVLLFLIFNAPLRVLIIMTFWDPPTDKKLAGTVFLLFSSIYSSGISFACLFIGYLNRRDDLEPIAVFLERILKDERNMAETTEADQQQA